MEPGNEGNINMRGGLREAGPQSERVTEASILVIDDDEVVLGVLKDLLELQGFRVLTARRQGGH